MPSETKTLTLNEFVQLFKDDKNSCSTSKYCFLLGAGASVSSGIPSASTLAKKWYEEIRKFFTDEQFIEWCESKKIDENNLASAYSTIYERRFEASPSNGYAEIQKQLENKEPSIGYAFFAKILAETSHRFVITTNFDSLIEDALFIYTKTKPLVCGHESLASYINVHGSRPTIVKIHRDVLFDPISDRSGTNDLKEQWQKALKPLLSAFNLVVIGYGGNDGSLMNYLEELKAERKPIYWCVRDINNINDDIKKALEEDDFFVKIDGFDKLMIELSSAYDLKINKDEIVHNAQIRIQKFHEERNKFGEEQLLQEKADKSGGEISPAIKEVLPEWWQYQNQINHTKNQEEKETLYLEGIAKLPKSYELLGNYAIFLHGERRNDEAEKYYQKTFELNPEYINTNVGYGVFLQSVRKNYDEAEKYYKKALKLNPEYVEAHISYAMYLHEIHKDYDEAEKHYKKALELNPEHINGNVNYAQLLLFLGRKKEAALYIQKAEKLLSHTHKGDAEIELWFYRLAHFPEYYEEAKENIELLLKEGVRSIGWDFSQNIEQAKKEGNTHIKELQVYADEITKVQ